MMDFQQASKKKAAKTPLLGGLGLKDTCQAAPKESRLGPRSTCLFGTRIVHVHFNAKRMNAAGWKIANCEHVHLEKLSDHNLIIATFEKT